MRVWLRGRPAALALSDARVGYHFHAIFSRFVAEHASPGPARRGLPSEQPGLRFGLLAAGRLKGRCGINARDAGGTIEFDDLHFRWGGLKASATGPPTRTPQPVGRLPGAIEDYDKILAALIARRMPRPDKAGPARLALTVGRKWSSSSASDKILLQGMAMGASVPDRLALKRLTRSDLTLFEAKYRTVKAGNQKAINLNADVFVSDLYPAAPSIAPTTDNEILLSLSIFGPDARGEDRMTRKIIKNPTYKNWRLNGEFISSPEGDPARYDALQPNDLAVMLFDGEPIPTSLKLCLISRSGPADSALYNELFRLLGNRSMIPISPEVLLGAASRAGTAPAHPVRGFANDSVIEVAIEDAALGGQSGIRTLRAQGRRLSAADLEKAKATQGAIGRDGEGLINALFQARIAKEEVSTAEWVADSNAISPYDFEIRTSAGDKFKIDVKSTRGPFDNDIHISITELVEAATSADSYSIYRVYELAADGGKLRIAADIREFAKSILASLSALPAGVNCDGFSVGVLSSGLVWGTETYVSRPDGDEDMEATEPPPAEAEQSVSLPVNSR